MQDLLFIFLDVEHLQDSASNVDPTWTVLVDSALVLYNEHAYAK